MLRSMTGYGKAEGAVGSRKYTVEVRSLNGKNLDLSVRMPSVLKEKEMELRKQLGARIVRGKSDVAIHFEADAAEAAGRFLKFRSSPLPTHSRMKYFRKVDPRC